MLKKEQIRFIWILILVAVVLLVSLAYDTRGITASLILSGVLLISCLVDYWKTMKTVSSETDNYARRYQQAYAIFWIILCALYVALNGYKMITGNLNQLLMSLVIILFLAGGVILPYFKRREYTLRRRLALLSARLLVIFLGTGYCVIVKNHTWSGAVISGLLFVFIALCVY